MLSYSYALILQMLPMAHHGQGPLPVLFSTLWLLNQPKNLHKGPLSYHSSFLSDGNNHFSLPGLDSQKSFLPQGIVGNQQGLFLFHSLGLNHSAEKYTLTSVQDIDFIGATLDSTTARAYLSAECFTMISCLISTLQ